MADETEPVVPPPGTLGRREMVRKAAYMVPLILAAVKATERPAFAQCPSGQAPVPGVPDVGFPGTVPGCA
jgi:hypothetical protein